MLIGFNNFNTLNKITLVSKHDDRCASITLALKKNYRSIIPFSIFKISNSNTNTFRVLYSYLVKS